MTMISANDIRSRYLKFFADRGHKIIPSAPIVPENDPTTLFTSSGMQPLVPNLLGQPHPSGTRLVNSQKCFRSQDIEEVGDNRHTTFFEMLGNWSLGEYFKKEQLNYFFEFLTNELDLSKDKLWVSVFEGNSSVPKDTESINIWKKIGIPESRIFAYPTKKNWWSRSGEPENMPPGEPGGPDSEVFYDFGEELRLHQKSEWANETCHPNCDCGRFLEIGNSVFMQYLKQADGSSLKELPKKNVDFGGGLERLTAAANNDPDIFNTDLFEEILKQIGSYCDKRYSEVENRPAMRVIADHLKAATFLIVDGVKPSNKTQGYFLRRLLRRAAVKMHQLKGGLTPIPAFEAICLSVLETYRDTSYFSEERDRISTSEVIRDEMGKFSSSLDRGLKEFNKYGDSQLHALNAFNLYSTHGFPYEVTEELYKQKGKRLDKKEFEEAIEWHKNLSRTASKGMFKGGLQDHSEITTKYHTATHLLHWALRDVLGDHVQQKGSNITADRLRFDFSHPLKLTSEEVKKVEDAINQKISENLKVTKLEMPKKKALAEGALAFFPEKYPDITSVYIIGDYSKELCGGPHVNSTGDIGRIKITKEESAGSGIRRLYAQLIPKA